MHSPSLKPQCRSALFQTIPPERIGLHGEYDHCGLAKRVRLLLEQEFAAEDIRNLTVLQRGRVVVFMGSVANRRLLNRLIQAALQVYGSADVESYGVTLETDDLWELEGFNCHFLLH